MSDQLAQRPVRARRLFLRHAQNTRSAVGAGEAGWQRHILSGEAFYSGPDMGTVDAALASGRATAQAIMAAGLQALPATLESASTNVWTNRIDQQCRRGETRSFSVVDRRHNHNAPGRQPLERCLGFGVVEERRIQRWADDHRSTPPDRLGDHG